jgi:hypothetical protein
MRSRIGAALLAVFLAVSGGTTAGQVKSTLRPPRLYALLIIDTDSNLREAVLKDRDYLRKLLKEAFKTRPNRLELVVLEGKAVTPDKVLGHCRKLQGKVRSVDTLFCHYSGHGQTRGGEHVLVMKHGELPRSKLRSALQALGGRLVVLTSDSCSDVPKRPQGRALPPLPKASWPVLDTLFFHHQGVTDINGCQQGAFCWNYYGPDKKDQGGVFTLALARLLCAKMEEFGKSAEQANFVSWEQFLEPLQQRTDGLFQEMLKAAPNAPDLSKQGRQTPHSFSLGRKAVQNIVDRQWLFGAEFGRRRPDGAAVVGKVYPDTPAAQAGFRKGDVIVAVNGSKAASPEDFVRLVEYSDGKLKVEFLRGGKKEEKTVICQAVKAKKPKQ